MLELIYGIAGSGKSQYIENTFKKLLSGGDKLMIVVPDQHSFITERSILEKYGAHWASKIKVMWFNNLAREISEKYGGVKSKTLANSGKAVLMSKALSLVGDDISFYKKQAKKPEFTNEILKITEEMKFSGVTTEDLLCACEKLRSNVLIHKLSEISLITDKYNELVGENYLDPDDRLIKVNETLEKNNFFGDYIVAIDSFGFFDTQKLDIIEKIILQAKDTYITLCTDSLEYSAADSDKFSDIKKTAFKLMDIAEKAGVEVKKRECQILPEVKNEFAYISRYLYENRYEQYKESTENVEIIECSDIRSECDAVALRIKKLLMTGLYRYKDMAVILRDENKYLPYLQRSFKKHSLPFFRDYRKGLSNEPLMLFCHFALKAVSGGFVLDDVMACAKSSIAGIETDDISDFENYCLMWNISGKNKWSKDFTYNPNGFTDKYSEDDSRLKKINSLRKIITEPLLNLYNKTADSTAVGIAGALYDLLIEVGAPENLSKLVEKLKLSDENEIAEEQLRVWEILINCLEQIVAVRGDEKMKAKDFLSLFDLAILSESIGEVPRRIDEITVGNADRIRTDMPKAAFILGANDGEFPKSFSESGILSDGDRISLRENKIELGISCETMSTQEKFYAYCAAAAPSEKLFISYKKSSFDTEELSPSSLVREIEKILPKCVFVSDAVTQDDILSEEQGFEVLSEIWKQDSTLRQSLAEIYKKSAKYSEKFKMLNELSSALPKSIENTSSAEKLFGGEKGVMSVSPTQIECFYKCPFMYFCKYGICAKPIEKAALDLRTGGTLIHDIMENFLSSNSKEKFIAMTPKEISEETNSLTRDYLKRLSLPKEFVSDRFLYLTSKDRKIAYATLMRTQQEMMQSDFVPAEFEKKIGLFSDSGNIDLPLKKGKISINGKVDRIDIMDKDGVEYVRVIDYKTGSKEFKLGEVLNGINAQMLIYLLALQSGKRYSSAVPAGVLYVQASNEPVSVSRGSSNQEVENELKKQFRMSGVVLENEVVIYGMEKNPNGKFIPVNETSRGFTGQLITTDEITALRKRLEKLIADMGNELFDGKIDANPIKTGTKSPCDFCDYKPVCRNTDKKREAVIPTFSEAIKELREDTDDE